MHKAIATSMKKRTANMQVVFWFNAIDPILEFEVDEVIMKLLIEI